LEKVRDARFVDLVSILVDLGTFFFSKLIIQYEFDFKQAFEIFALLIAFELAGFPLPHCIDRHFVQFPRRANDTREDDQIESGAN
jgi:hypothetical protein